MALLSIIIPVYNTQDYVAECLESLLRQTLKDIEIICVNDGSTDNSMEILSEYGNKDERIHIVDKKNGGLSSARNAGLDCAHGRYVCFLDSDDLYRDDLCERILFEAIGKGADIVVFGFENFPSPCKEGGWFDKVSSPRDVFYYSFVPYALFHENGSHPFVWRNCYKKAFLEEKGIRFDEGVKYGEDVIFQFKSFPHAERISFISDKLYLYRRARPESMMLTYVDTPDKKVDEHMTIIETVSRDWRENGKLKEMEEDFFKWTLNFIVNDITKASAGMQKSTTKRLEQCWQGIDQTRHYKRLNAWDKGLYDKLFKKKNPFPFLKIGKGVSKK